MLRLSITGVAASVTEKETLTAGRVGLQCGFSFDAVWNGLFKTAVFEGVETVDVALDDSNVCTVPWECMEVEGVQLKCGVYGANGEGTIVIPTVWANFGKIQPSPAPSGTEPTAPTQNANAYAVETAEEALSIAQSVRDDADNGAFDGADGADGADGFSPIASVSKVGDTATITITDENGTTTATISDGTNGTNGTNGQDGDDGSGVWKSSTAPTESGAFYIFDKDDLTGRTGAAPAGGDIVFYSYYYYTVSRVEGDDVVCDTRTSIRGSQGSAGQGVPSGGTTGQVLAKKSNTNYDTEWVNAGGGGGTPYTSNPAALGTASPGSSDDYSRGDHVHEDNQFWATYNTTTSAQLEAAYQAGKDVLCDYSGSIYRLTARTSSTIHVFTSNLASGIKTFAVQSDVWSTVSTKSIPSLSSSTPSALGTAAAGSSTDASRSDHVHAMPSASDVGAVAVAQGVAHAGEFVVVGSDGNITTVTMTAWQGGNY